MKLKLRLLVLVALTALCAPTQAEKKYGPGASDVEIKIGNTMPYSGNASAYGTIGKTEAAYFQMINERGGVNGRKLNFISLDDGYSPPRTVEQIRRLVEEDQVLFIYSSLGTPPNTAIHKYMNAKQVPQLFVATGATKWGDPKNFPWTIGFQPTYHLESRIYAKYILDNNPNAKIGILYQNDDYGKDYYRGFKEGLGDKSATMVVKEVTYEVTDATVDSQIVDLKSSGADTFINITTPKFAAQAIRKAYDIGWKPVQFLNLVSSSIAAVLKPAGVEKAVDIISTGFLKDVVDPAWKDDAGVKDYFTFMKNYNPDADPNDYSNVYGYSSAQTLIHTLKLCGDDLTRENVMRQAANIKDLELPMLLPGIKINTSPTDFYPIKQEQLVKFNGKRWVPFGGILTGH